MDNELVEAVALEPCPFCGGEATCSPCDDSGEVAYAVACMSCLAQITKCDEAGAIEQWNTRTPLASLKAENEALCKAVFLDGHSEGWRGNQLRRDTQMTDAEKSWQLYVSNGALAKTVQNATSAALTKQGG